MATNHRTRIRLLTPYIADPDRRVDELEADHEVHDKYRDALGMGIERAHDDIADLEDQIDRTVGEDVTIRRCVRCPKWPTFSWK